MKKVSTFLMLMLLQFSVQAFSFSDSSFLIVLNQQIDDYVVSKNTAALSKLYAADFIFSHGSGKIEGKHC
jgi:hypothetical protein